MDNKESSSQKEDSQNEPIPLDYEKMDNKESSSQKEDSQNDLKPLDYEGVLQKIGAGRAQWIVLITCGVTLFMGMNEIVGIGFIAITSKCDFHLSSIDKGFLTGAGLIGNICSSYFWGYISDTIGRRPVLIATTFSTNVFSFISMFIPNFWVFVLLRFCAGFCVSGSINISYVYLGEFFTAQYRALAINYASLFVAFSGLFDPAVASLVLLMDWSLEITAHFHFRPWRLLPFLYVLPGFLSGIALCYLPETPKILFSLGKPEKAYESLDWICRKNHKGRTYDEVVGMKLKSIIKGGDDIKVTAEKKLDCAKILPKMWNDAYSLFKPPVLKSFALCCVLMCSIFTSYLGMGFWYPEIQNSLRLYGSAGNKMKTCDIMENSLMRRHENHTIQLECSDKIQPQTYIDCYINGAICVVGYSVLGIIIKLFGRKRILIGFLGTGGILALSLLCIVEPYGIVISFSLFLVLTQLCMSTMSGVIVDLIPTHLCGQAICVCLMFGRLCSVITTNFVGAMMETHCELIFILVSGFSISCAVLAFMLPIDQSSRKISKRVHVS